MARISGYVCDVCGEKSTHRFKVKAKRLKEIHKWDESGHYTVLRWVKIDLCERCWLRIMSECFRDKGGQNV